MLFSWWFTLFVFMAWCELLPLELLRGLCLCGLCTLPDEGVLLMSHSRWLFRRDAGLFISSLLPCEGVADLLPCEGVADLLSLLKLGGSLLE